MIPDNVASSISFAGLYLPPEERVTGALVDYERGGYDLLDASQGLMVRNWKCFLQGIDVVVQPDGGSPTVLFQEAQITELSLAFDQNMRWAVAYTKEAAITLRWYDSTVGDHVVTNFGPGRNPRIGLDDKRESQLLRSDMILAYIRDNGLYYRQQRDRFGVEYTLRDDLFPNTRLKNMGMNKNLRLQFELV